MASLVPIRPQTSTILQVTPEALPKFHIRHTKINEDEDEPEEDWKVEADESDSDIDAGDMSDGDVERRIRARMI